MSRRHQMKWTWRLFRYNSVDELLADRAYYVGIERSAPDPWGTQAVLYIGKKMVEVN